MPGTAILVAACSAAGFALSSSLQHLAAGTTRGTARSTHRLLAHLASHPWWVVGQVLAFVSFGLHALALHLGNIVVVQPVVVSGIVLAVPVRAALARRLPSRGELGTVSVTAAGLALFLVSARPTDGQMPTSLWSGGALTAGGVVVAATAIWWAGHCRVGERAALTFGIASGVMFGLTAGLVKLTTSLAASGPHPWSFLTFWSTWAVVLIGLTGVAVNQRAYRAARMSASLPVLNITDVLVALLFGIVVFGETPAHTPLAIAGEVVAFVLVVVGLRRLSSEVDFVGQPPEPVPATPATPAA